MGSGGCVPAAVDGDAGGQRTGAVPLVAMTCSIRYGTDGDADVGGMDRGRLLAAMDAELGIALGSGGAGCGREERAEGELRGAGGGFGDGGGGGDGDERVLGRCGVRSGGDGWAERLERTATVEVFGFVEAGS